VRMSERRERSRQIRRLRSVRVGQASFEDACDNLGDEGEEPMSVASGRTVGRGATTQEALRVSDERTTIGRRSKDD